MAALLLLAACSPAADETATTQPDADASDATAATTADADPSTTQPGTTATSTSSTTTTSTTSSTTTTSSTRATTTQPPTTTSTLAVPPGNKPPTVEIISPAHLSSHIAVYDANAQRFSAAVSLSAVVSDPNGDEVTVMWSSSDEGSLGTGESIIATLHTGHFDSAQPQITARATDQWGTSTEATVQIIVWIPSDT